jgi:hypothetical protein
MLVFGSPATVRKTAGEYDSGDVTEATYKLSDSVFGNIAK